MTIESIRRLLFEGQVIPAIPLALHDDGSFDESHQRALLRYYIDSGAGGIAAAVHTTQFVIREDLRFFRYFLRFVNTEIDSFCKRREKQILKIGGICGDTKQARSEAELLRESGFHAGLLSLSAFTGREEKDILEHSREVAEHIPIIGFYLQSAVGGIKLSQSFWKHFAQIDNIVGIKVAPFNRYKTLDVIRAVSESGRGNKLALYTGNDDSIIYDLLSPYPFPSKGSVNVEFSGGLLGQWCVWTKKAVEILEEIKIIKKTGKELPLDLLLKAQKMTDANAAIFDAANDFAGVIPGVHEILRRQGLLSSRRCLDPALDTSEGQIEEIDRVTEAYPELQDDDFIRENIEHWLKEK